MIGLSNVSSRLVTNLMTFDCVRQKWSEDFNGSAVKNPYGINQFKKEISKATCDIELDAYDESASDISYYSMKFLLENRKYEKKLFLNYPAVTAQLLDFVDRSPQYTRCYWSRNSTGAPETVYTSCTEFSVPEYNQITSINTTYYQYTGHLTDTYGILYFAFDITDWIDTYGIDSIDRFTLFMHNPYFNQNSTWDGYKMFVLQKEDAGTGLSRTRWKEIGQQSLSISDVDLRATNQMNQVFYSVKKHKEFSKMSYCIDTGGTHFGHNSVAFAMVNMTPGDTSTNFDLGLNYVGLIINGLGVRQIGNDNFTYNSPYTGSGMTASLTFAEV